MSYAKPQMEVGSNLFEVIEFTVSSKSLPSPILNANPSAESQRPNVFAVNVAKVREVIRLPEITPCLTHTPELLGVFNLRGIPIPAIHLSAALGISNEPIDSGAQVIVTEFSRRVAGFVVNSARRIRRVSWDRVLPPSSDALAAITGMMLVENNEFVFILDFERILLAIESKRKPDESSQNQNQRELHLFGSNVTIHGAVSNASGQMPSDRLSQSNGPKSEGASSARFIVVDDSPTARRSLIEFLRSFETEIVEFTNGEAAWVFLQDQVGLLDNTLVISDVEMPRLDGYSLVTRLRKHAELKSTKIILHSSLTGEANRDRALKAGADAYVGKFNRKEIIEAIGKALPDLVNGKKASA
jgi:two-component system, chemotaxis family, chemotaxis protein CheV